MQSTKLTYFTAMVLCAGLIVPVQSLRAQQKNPRQPAYYVFNLGAPLGGNAEPVGINNLGWISGGDNLTGNTLVNAELWIGAPLDLGTLGGPNSTVAWPNHSTRGEI